MVANIRGYTPNYGLKLINFDTPRWHTLEYSNWELVDAIMASTGLPGLRGEWINSTSYIAGQRVFDAADGKIYGCLVTHTSAATGTFAADRAAHPTYWLLATLDTPRYRGVWIADVAYSVADIVVVGSYIYYICIYNHISSSTVYPPNASIWSVVFDATAAVNATNASATAAAGSASQAATSASSAATSATNSQASAVESAAQAAKLYGTSITSNTAVLGPKTFITQANKYFNVGKFVMVRANADPVNQWMWGQVTAYSGTTLAVNALTSGGSGTYADWIIDVSGSRGAIGPQGPQGELGPPLVIKGTVPTAAALPPSGNTIGDMWIAEDTQNLHIWDGTMWDNAGPLGTSTTTTADVPPSNPKDGDMWWESDSGIFWVRYDDGNSSQWIQAGGAAASINQNFVLKTGDTMTGILTLQNTVGGWPGIIISRDVGNKGAFIQGTMNATPRWTIYLGNTDAEAGSNSGSSFQIFSYNDAGTFLSAPLSINRATGATTLAGALNVDAANVGGATPSANVSSISTYVVSCNSAGHNAFMDAAGVWRTRLAGYSYVVGMDTASGYIHWYSGASAAAGGATALTDRMALGPTGNLWIINAIASTSPTTGALLVAGGVGIAGALNVGTANSSFIPSGGLVPVIAAAVKVAVIGGHIGINSRANSDAGFWHMGFENLAGSAVGSIVTSAASTGFNTTSDAALKEDLKSFDAGSIIDNTQVYDFAWKSTKERAFGVVAQQAVEVYPQAITHTEKVTTKGEERDEWWGVDYSKYVPVLLQELKASRQRERELVARIEALEEKLPTSLVPKGKK